MKTTIRAICLLLVLSSLLCACGKDQPTTTTTVPTTTQPTLPPEPVLPTLADINRPLPTLAEKKVTDAPAEGDLVLAKDGAANATIVYPESASKAKSAADDLANYLQKITGSAFTVISDAADLPEGNLILVGMTKKTAELGFEPITGFPHKEEYRIAVQDNCLVLYGNDEGAYGCTQYAVTRFLEEAGCGWYAKEDLWNVVPSCPNLGVKQWNQNFKPLFSGRKISWSAEPILKRWLCGGDSFTFGHTLWWGEGGLVHVDEYKEHPEWFAMINGERPSPSGNWQYCYTNPEFIDTVAQRIIDQFNNHPHLLSYSVSANDAWDEGWCDCPDCLAKGNRSDQMLYFANEVAKIVCEVHPDRRINFLAYHATFLPPESGIKAHPNVEVMFTMETNPLTDPTLDWVVHEGKNGMTKVAYTQSWQDNVAQWIEKTDLQHSSIWCWLCISTGSDIWRHAPWIQGNTVTRTFDLYKQLGVDIIFADWGAELLDIRWPLIYVYARSMWDDAVDGETVLYDACKKLYGAAADEMFLLYRILSDCAAINVDEGGLTWVPPALFSVYGDYVTEIQAAADAVSAKMDQLTPEQKERVQLHLSSWRYAEAVM